MRMSGVFLVRRALRPIRKFFQIRRRLEHYRLIKSLQAAAIRRYEREHAASITRYAEINEFRYKNASLQIPENVKDVVFSFVLLQFNQYDVTRMAVDSILRLESPCNVHIVIVDNGSTAPGRELLEADFASLPTVHFVSTGENLGFARGNNFGYSYAKRTLKSHFICVANNDVTWPDRATIAKALSLYRLSHYSILGPNVEVRGEGKTVYQNPMKRALQTRSEAILALRKYEKLSLGTEGASLKPPQVLGSRKKTRASIDGEVVLHGSAYVFSPAFVCNRDIVFDERTFLYGEEALLALNALGEGYKMAYEPGLLALHHAKASTNLGNLAEFYAKSGKWHTQSITAYINRIDEILSSSARG